MKNLILVITLILGINVCAQDEFVNGNVFVRVYDLQNKKIGKGKIFSFSGTALKLTRNGKPVEILISNIGKIRTKHSAGNNVLIGAASGAVTMALIGVATADPDVFLGYTAGEGAAAGALIGGILGAAVGGITIPFKNSKSYRINGDMEKWKAFKEVIIK